MADGATFDLANYVRLTSLGTRWAERVKQLEAEIDSEAKAAEGAGITVLVIALIAPNRLNR